MNDAGSRSLRVPARTSGAGFAGFGRVAASRPHRLIIDAGLPGRSLRTRPTLLQLPLRIHRPRQRKRDKTQHSNTKKNDTAYHKETDKRITLTAAMTEQHTRASKQAKQSDRRQGQRNCISPDIEAYS